VLHDLHQLSLEYFGFSGIQQNPASWVGVADNLHESARVIWQAYSAEWELTEQFWNRPLNSQIAPPSKERLALFQVGLMLLGFAMENLLKALLLAQDSSIVADGKLKWPGKTGHELGELAEAAGLTLNAGEGQILDNLKEFVLWAGRYPLPKKQLEQSSEQGLQINLWENACRLFDRLRSNPAINSGVAPADLEAD
jgi:hypothetical protein